jgi:hypothetical protein
MFGLTRYTSFGQVSSDPNVVAKLRTAYGGDANIDQCDLYVCGLAEGIY